MRFLQTQSTTDCSLVGSTLKWQNANGNRLPLFKLLLINCHFVTKILVNHTLALFFPHLLTYTYPKTMTYDSRG